MITTIGAANIDVTATLTGTFAALSNNPSRVQFSYGGSARNVAHNLCLLGEHVQLLSVIGGDVFGGFLLDNCKKHGIDVHLCERRQDLRTSTYVALNNSRGDRITGAVDAEVLTYITPELLSAHIQEINDSDAVVMDTNLPVESMRYLLERCDALLYANVVSALRANDLIEALQAAVQPNLFALRITRKDALASTGAATIEQAAERFINMGVQFVYITMSEDGVYCQSQEAEQHFAPYEVDLVNTMGAGDAFIAGVVLAVKNGIPFPTTAQFGLRVAAATVNSERVVNPELLNILRQPQEQMDNSKQ